MLLCLLLCTACRHAEKTGTHLTWATDSAYVYHTTFFTSATLQGASTVELQLDSDLELRVLAAHDAIVELSVRAIQPSLTSGNGVVDPAIDAAQADLTKSFWIELHDGVVDKERFPAGMSAAAVAVDRSLVAALQLPAHSATSTTWRASEFDGTGRYSAEYKLVNGTEKDPRVSLAKEKLAFEDLLATGKVAPVTRASLVPKVTASRLQLDLNAQTLTQAHGEEQLESVVMGAPLVTRTKLALELKQMKPSATTSAARAELFANTVEFDPGAAYGKAPGHERFDALRIEGRTFESVLAELQRAAREPHAEKLVASKNGQTVPEGEQAAQKQLLGKELTTFSALTALLRQDSANVAKANAAILAGSPASRDLIDGLGSAGTTEAQRSLAALALDTKSAIAQRAEAATSLIRTEHPTPESVTAMRALTLDPDLADFGVYGIGTASRHEREDGKPVEADVLAKELVELLRAAKSDGARIRALRGIANSAYDGAVPSIRPLLKAEQPSVRAAAIEAVRLVKTPLTDELVAQTMTQETSNTVRSAAIRVAAGRAPTDTLVSALSETALRGEDAVTRQQAVELIANWLPQRQNLRATLEQVAERDQEPRIRDVALAALKKS